METVETSNVNPTAKAYSTPQLLQYGDLGELTRASGRTSRNMDGGRRGADKTA
jgi:hypothetical protein